MKLRNILFSLAVAAASLTGCSKEERGFVAVENGEFVRDGKTMTFVISAKTIGEAVKIIKEDEENVEFFVGRRHVAMSVDGYSIVSRKIEGEFFDYKKTIPSSFATTVTVSTKELISIIDRISLIINDHLKTPTRCNIENDQIVFSCSTGLGRATDSYKVEVNGDTFEIGLNSRYLLEALKACESDETVINFNGPFSVIIIKPIEGDDYLYMMMPTRLKAE